MPDIRLSRKAVLVSNQWCPVFLTVSNFSANLARIVIIPCTNDDESNVKVNKTNSSFVLSQCRYTIVRNMCNKLYHNVKFISYSVTLLSLNCLYQIEMIRRNGMKLLKKLPMKLKGWLFCRYDFLQYPWNTCHAFHSTPCLYVVYFLRNSVIY